ncbi:MAG: hypothetical protein DRI26_02120 [Chloroflexi bacterium]|nr:MAG: hypothetical protein DRI26_02120 [Chloroflexota bacterium]
MQHSGENRAEKWGGGVGVWGAKFVRSDILGITQGPSIIPLMCVLAEKRKMTEEPRGRLAGMAQ